MKVKKIEQKLSLNKETIAHLGSSEMKDVVGGISGSWCGNPTCKFDCSRVGC
ncbi:MAG: rSAM-modified peptide [bacterium]|nr:rSAM-modified peptide [bacterium]